MSKNTEFLFVRHGITELNVKKVYFGQLNPPLIAEGIQQIHNAKKNVADESISLFYSSDLKRCTESAEIINEHLNLNIIEKPGFRELNFGIFEGLSHQELMGRYPEEAELFFKNWENYQIPDGESIHDFMMRAVNEIEDIKKSHKGEKILITTHSGVIQAVLSFYFTGNLEAYWKFRFNHGSITKLCFDHSDFAFLEYVNRV
ncbi:histidine phosphatase family protein [Sebaldella sp. S0638]|uniref:histidine phosphatase family protein n=1 Tax=Sebaldella sp. S0638 TaxID=2957809 RepID=UPI00209F87D4|nr:histidine phosphatase family protein [Sebaldella sp. S0638]MCP1225033.1 histidine phosphatase family protein [Sebaldella sp. S0638]